MTKRLLYIPILLLFIVSAAALVSHYSNIGEVHARFMLPARLPFGYMNGRAFAITPPAAEAGVRIGDRIDAINGRLMDTERSYDEEFMRMTAGEPMTITMARRAEDGSVEKVDVTVIPTPIKRDLNLYVGIVANFIFIYALPTLCILLGFWVLFVRPTDPLAWILLFVLLGVGALGLEMYWDITTLLGIFQKVAFASWALGMLLFGIYFPERWSLDERFPWIKWLLIVPLGFQILFTLLSTTG